VERLEWKWKIGKKDEERRRKGSGGEWEEKIETDWDVLHTVYVRESMYSIMG
jgi:hypothetical protein